MENWQIELHRLLEIFEQESMSSLRKINRCLVASGQPFGENFRQYFLKVSNLRLDTSFNIVLFEHENRMQITPSASASTNNASKVPKNANLSNSSHANSPNAPADGNSLDVKTEHHIDDLIEIADSSDDEEVPEESKILNTSTETNALTRKIVRDSEKRNNNTASIEVVDSDDDEGGAEDSAMQVINSTNGGQTLSIEASELNSGADRSNDETIDINMNDPNGIEDDAKARLKKEMESPSELIDLPLVTFDPNAENGDSDVESGETDAGLLTDQNQPSTSSSAKNRFKCNKCTYTAQYKNYVKKHQTIHQSAKSFKCALCDYAARHKCNLVAHLRTHDRQKLMGVVQDANSGLFKCIHCDQHFAKWKDLNIHLTLSHKDNQRLFNCMHCMRRFTKESEKNRHELQCQKRRYECYLCKAYVVRSVKDMQQHMRTHTGAKPFQCAICNKCFRHKVALRRHLDSVHTQA